MPSISVQYPSSMLYISTFSDINVNLFFVFTGMAQIVGNFITVETEH